MNIHLDIRLTRVRTLALAAIAVAQMACFGPAQAQSQYSIPNPLIRPSSYAQGKGAAGHGSSVPAPMDGSAPSAPQPSLPSPVGTASIPGQNESGNAPGNETVIRETLATFSVTAIVGNRAVLRNNVGTNTMQTVGVASSGGGQDVNSSGKSSSAGGGQPLGSRQAVIRVKSDVSVFISGVELTPTVLGSRVEFRLSGRRNIVATVTLESESSYGYTPPAIQREAMDPTVAHRVTPLISGLSSDASNNSPSSGGTNGAAPTQH
jgi:hypothetical protein